MRPFDSASPKTPSGCGSNAIHCRPRRSETTGSWSSSTDQSVVVAERIRIELESVRDERLQPLIDHIREPERDRGRLEAERDRAQRERDDERRRREAVESRVSALEAQQTEQAVSNTSARQRDTDSATDAPRWAFWKRFT
jgi:hypothetical protein